MAEFEWSHPAQPAAEQIAPPWLRRLSGRLTDWEDWLTLVLALGAAVSVSLSLEQSGWSDDMPPITLVSILALVTSLFVARSGLSMLAAWPLAVLAGVLVVFWQTLELVGPGNLGQRLDAIQFRFEAWFDLAIHNGVSNDSLPFNVLVLSLTWLGVFLFGWSVFRWQNAWIGLIPGGITLFLDMALVGDDLAGSALLYMLFGFLLVMRTNLMARIQTWRREGTPYPQLISLTFLNFSTWTLIVLLAFAWILPTGPFTTPAPVEAMVRGVEEVGVNFVRLSGPLKVKRVVPVHNYTGVLPFQGSIELGDREVMTVTVNDPAISGVVRLRGAVYDEYGGGGWKAGNRTPVDLPQHLEKTLQAEIKSGEASGEIIPLTVTVERKSVVGTVLFAPGEPLATSVSSFDVEVPESGLVPRYAQVEDGGEGLPDEEILTRIVAEQVGEDYIGLTAQRDEEHGLVKIGVMEGRGESLPDSLVTRPASRVGQNRSYNISGFIPIVSEEKLRAANAADPSWVQDQYLRLPADLPPSIKTFATDITKEGATRYDRAVLARDYLRTFPVDFDVPDTPPGRDTVDYFLNDSQRGYFDYHASALAVMLRTLGIPSRLAVGFVIDEADKDLESGSYSIRDLNSYAWTEVYFPGYGWIAFNPSPDRPADLNPIVEAAPEGSVEPGSLEKAPFGPVADPVFDIPTQTQGSDGTVPTVGDGRDYDPLITVGVAAFLALLAGSVFLGWQRSVAGLPHSQQLWEKTVRLATWAGHGPRTGQTPSDFARSLKRGVRDAEDISILAAAYNRSRFGRADSDKDRARLNEIWSPLRNALLGAIVRRITWRGRHQNHDPW
jgi:transglutaminase-like putative cysteine protease